MKVPLWRLALIAGGAVYAVTLVWTYVRLVSPLYAYMGFSYSRPVLGVLVLYLLMAISPCLWMPLALIRPSQVAYWMLYLLAIVPALTVPALVSRDAPGSYLPFAVVLWTSFAALGAIYRLPLLGLPRLGVSRKAFWLLLLVLSAIFYAHIFSNYGLPRQLVSFDQVYATRAAYKSVAAGAGRFTAYALEWQANVINTLLMTLGFVQRRWVLGLVGALGQVAIYSITGYKSVLLSGGLLAALWIASVSGGRGFGLITMWATAGGTALLALIARLSSATGFAELFLERMFATPGLLSAQYFDFFSSHRFALLGNSVLKRFFAYPYDADIPDIIGRTYWFHPETSANAHFWADAFAQFNYLGVVDFTLLLALVFWVYDSISERVDWRIPVLMIGLPAFTLANSALLTSLLSHGIGLMIVLLYLMPPRRLAGTMQSLGERC